ncbi:MAG: site-specific DNA-methyltransferase [Deltaproteobacteria bacterium]|nr:site-specific DNA-methyltransferase [Deltaproteobacteria bacterium]
MWDAREGCRHRWIKATRRNQSGGTSTNSGLHKPGVHKFSATVGFCRECGAWRGELGLEPTPELYIEHLCQVFDEVGRVLKRTGTCWVVMGDTYGGSGQGWGKRGKARGRNSIDRRPTGILCADRPRSYSAPPKSLSLIPSRFAIEMCNRGWTLRNIVIWHKQNHMPASVKDRFTNSYEQVFMLVRSRKYWFDLDAVRLPYKASSIARSRYSHKSHPQSPYKDQVDGENMERFVHPLGKNPGDLWTIPTRPFRGAHFATFPEKLVEPMIKAGCPEGGVVLDPFIGSGTTAVVARRLGRQFMGIDINPDYCEMARKRITKQM